MCVVNPVGPDDLDDATVHEAAGSRWSELIDVVELDVNLGWSGGLHAGRVRTVSEFLVWIQDDMVVADGWLDALVSAAETNRDVGAFGSAQVDERGVISLFNAGKSSPVGALDRWNDTDETASGLPNAVTRYDWITSKGMLTRASSWDDVGGPDPGLFPLNHVDKDYCSHLRVHGWAVALVPDAHLRHRGNQSAPGLLREFLGGWQHARLKHRWTEPLAAIGSGGVGIVDHDCTRERAAEVEHWVAREATRFVVDFGRWAETRRQHDEDQLEATRADLSRAAADAVAVRQTLSWRITAPIRAVRRATLRLKSRTP